MDFVIQAASPLLATAFGLWNTPVTWLEVLAFGLSVWMVLLNMRVHVAAWPLAMVSSLLYSLLFAQSKLYGEASLQLFFMALAGWGWWQWRLGHQANGAELVIRRLGARQRWQALAMTLAAWPLLALALMRWTDSDVPFLDALPTVGSIAGQFLLGHKLIENWPVWVAVNAFSLLLFAAKGLWLTVLLYALFLILAVVGWRTWRRLEGQAHA